MEKSYQKEKRNIFLPIVAVIALAGLVGWYWYANIRGFISTDDASIDTNQSTISAKILGRIQALVVNENDTVQAGQLLVQIDDSDLRAQENQSKASLAYAQQNVTLAKVNLDKAQDDFNRSDTQFKGGFISKQDYDHSQKALDANQAQYAIALAQVDTARTQLGVVETSLLNTKITSPISGVIAKRWVLSGDVVQPGQPIFSIFDVQNVWVTAYFEETKLGVLRINQPVEITADGYPGYHFIGRISEVGSSTASQFSLIPPNNAAGNFTKVTQRIPVKIVIKNADHTKPLLPGMSVDVKVKVN